SIQQISDHTYAAPQIWRWERSSWLDRVPCAGQHVQNISRETKTNDQGKLKVGKHRQDVVASRRLLVTVRAHD
ncbi:MAG TPA: hypothetical protein VHX44_09805, partial [Planctomycetota bacterium]|nr:hypothetical protein [Planctomycetota bacterium]